MVTPLNGTSQDKARILERRKLRRDTQSKYSTKNTNGLSTGQKNEWNYRRRRRQLRRALQREDSRMNAQSRGNRSGNGRPTQLVNTKPENLRASEVVTQKPTLGNMHYDLFSKIWSGQAAPSKDFLNRVETFKINTERLAAKRIQNHVRKRKQNNREAQRKFIKVGREYLSPKKIIQELRNIAIRKLNVSGQSINQNENWAKYRQMTFAEFARVVAMYVRFTNANGENIKPHLQNIINAKLFPAITQYNSKVGNYKALRAAYQVRDNPEGATRNDFLVMKIPYANSDEKVHNISDKTVFHAVQQYIRRHPKVNNEYPKINKKELERYVLHYAYHAGEI